MKPAIRGCGVLDPHAVNASRPSAGRAGSAGACPVDEQTFRAIVETLAPTVLSVAFELKDDRAVADDFAVEAFAKLCKSGVQGNVEMFLTTLLRTVVETAERRHRFPLGLAAWVRKAVASPSSRKQRHSAKSITTRLQELPFRLRTVLVLREIAALPLRSISEMMGCDDRKVRNLLIAARTALIEGKS